MRFTIAILILVAITTSSQTVSAISAKALGIIKKTLQAEFNLTFKRPLGEGVSGAVYEATVDGKVSRAVKLNLSPPGDTSRWFSEVAHEWSCQTLTTHEHLMQVYSSKTVTLPNNRQIRVTITELLGLNLDQLLSKTEEDTGVSGLARSVVAQIALQISDVLVHLHSHGIVHHDIKLENIVMAEQTNPRKDLTDQMRQAAYKLIDLGLCRQYPNRASLESSFYSGTQVYLSPEKLDPSQPYSAFAADAYALGTTLAWALMGETLNLIAEDLEDGDLTNPMYTVYQIYRSKYLPKETHQDAFLGLVGRLLVTDPSKRLSIEDFNTYLKMNES